jgi:hypothetical protein
MKTGLIRQSACALLIMAIFHDAALASVSSSIYVEENYSLCDCGGSGVYLTDLDLTDGIFPSLSLTSRSINSYSVELATPNRSSIISYMNGTEGLWASNGGFPSEENAGHLSIGRSESFNASGPKSFLEMTVFTQHFALSPHTSLNLSGTAVVLWTTASLEGGTYSSQSQSSFSESFASFSATLSHSGSSETLSYASSIGVDFIINHNNPVENTPYSIEERHHATGYGVFTPILLNSPVFNLSNDSNEYLNATYTVVSKIGGIISPEAITAEPLTIPEPSSFLDFLAGLISLGIITLLCGRQDRLGALFCGHA